MVTVAELCGRLVLPNSPRPLSERNIKKYFEQGGIVPKRIKPEGSLYSVNHVTEEEAARVEALFRAKHWRKYRAAEAAKEGGSK